MTVHTLSRKPDKLTARMAIFAQNINVRSGQWEVTEVVIKGGILPIERSMAGSAVRTEATIMLVILLMAGIAISGRTLEYVVLMAFLAVHTGMFPLQFEGRQVMVKRCFLPRVSRMAGITNRAKT